MAAEENKRLVRRYVEDAIDKVDLDLLDELFADQFVNHHHASGRDREGLKRFLQRSLTSHPQQHTIKHLIAEGDTVAAHVKVQGTSRGDFQGLNRPDNTFHYETVNIFRIENGKIAERWYVSSHVGR
jgi:predicted SnoaL-like aldol condensation-catalyzing enzyme